MKRNNMRPFTTKWAYVWNALDKALRYARAGSSMSNVREALNEAAYHSRRYCSNRRSAGSLGNTVAAMIEDAANQRTAMKVAGGIEATMRVVDREAARAAVFSEKRNGVSPTERGIDHTVAVPFNEAVRRYKALFKAVLRAASKD